MQDSDSEYSSARSDNLCEPCRERFLELENSYREFMRLHNDCHCNLPDLSPAISTPSAERIMRFDNWSDYVNDGFNTSSSNSNEFYRESPPSDMNESFGYFSSAISTPSFDGFFEPNDQNSNESGNFDQYLTDSIGSEFARARYSNDNVPYTNDVVIKEEETSDEENEETGFIIPENKFRRYPERLTRNSNINYHETRLQNRFWTKRSKKQRGETRRSFFEN